MPPLLVTLTLAFQEDLDGGKKLCGLAHALFSPLAFRMKPGILIGQQSIVLFFAKNLRQPDWMFPGLDQMASE